MTLSPSNKGQRGRFLVLPMGFKRRTLITASLVLLAVPLLACQSTADPTTAVAPEQSSPSVQVTQPTKASDTAPSGYAPSLDYETCKAIKEFEAANACFEQLLNEQQRAADQQAYSDYQNRYNDQQPEDPPTP